mgnify:CR=1 FL=1
MAIDTIVKANFSSNIRNLYSEYLDIDSDID